jgi:hypothetical protein
MKFDLGQIVATPGALTAMAEAGQMPLKFIARHLPTTGAIWTMTIALKTSGRCKTAVVGCGSHAGQIFENLIEQAVEGCPKRGRCDAQDGD